jgi:hypothetical protein
MPACNSCPLDAALAKTKSRKSHKGDKCCPPSPCNVNCCKPECEFDCCALPYQRLDKLRTAWSEIAATGGSFLPTSATSTSQIDNVTTRGGANIAVPETGSLYPNGEDSIATYSGSVDVALNNAYYAYLFTQTHRYLNFEACGKLDQVVGWYVNTSNGELELFQALPDLNLLISDTRAYLDDQAVPSLSSTEKAKLYALNVLYKVSLKAIEAVGQNPKTEGNIVAVTDKCGQKWLVAINRADGDQSVCDVNTQYAIVAIPLC